MKHFLILSIIISFLSGSIAMAVTDTPTVENKKDIFVFITSKDTQTQFMALVLTNKIADRNKNVRVLLCSHGGDIALKNNLDISGKKSPSKLLNRLIKNNVPVQICPPYLPSRKNITIDDMINGVTQAHPDIISRQMLDDNAKLFTF